MHTGLVIRRFLAIDVKRIAASGACAFRKSERRAGRAAGIVTGRRAQDNKGNSMSERESMPYDVVIVGAGPAGLSAAIRLKQLAAAENRDIDVCVLEKGSEVGAHILSGAVVDPIALDELIPDWKDRECPMAETPVVENHHWVLTQGKKYEMPHLMMPSFMNNKGTYTGSLGNMCRWLAGQAEELGVEIFSGLCRRRNPVQRGWFGQGRGHRRHGCGPRWQPQGGI